jgi:hypothetical protein
MYRVKDPEGELPNLIWSDLAPIKMDRRDANDFCRTIGEDWHLPSDHEFKALARAMGKGTSMGYKSNLVFSIRDQFWTSSDYPRFPGDYDGAPLVFDGSLAQFYYGPSPGSELSVRCVREVSDH